LEIVFVGQVFPVQDSISKLGRQVYAVDVVDIKPLGNTKDCHDTVLDGVAMDFLYGGGPLRCILGNIVGFSA
jgi:hypothetical protein